MKLIFNINFKSHLNMSAAETNLIQKKNIVSDDIK